jgi:putative ABC transport system ATP-binding protein
MTTSAPVEWGGGKPHLHYTRALLLCYNREKASSYDGAGNLNVKMRKYTLMNDNSELLKGGEQAPTSQAGSSDTKPGDVNQQQATESDQTADNQGAHSIQDLSTMPRKAVTRLGDAGTTITSTPIVDVRNLTKTYIVGRTRIPALQGISLRVYQGEFVAVMGPSGSGKSTFMNLVGCLDRPSKGEYWLAGKLVSRLSNDELANIRNRQIGFVFQGFNLLSRSDALSNVILPMVYAGISREERERRGRSVLRLVGLGERMNHKPSELSGGQQQRVAIARALVNGPAMLLADEPTGNLDSRTSLEIMAVLQALNEQGLTILMVTHEPDIAKFAKRQVAFRDGLVVHDEQVLSPSSAKDEWTKLVNKAATEHKVKVTEVTH